MFLAGVGEVDFTRALSQRVTKDVQTVTYFLTNATQKVLQKMKFVTIVVRKVIMHIVVGQIVRVEIQLEVQVQVMVQAEVEVEVTTEVEVVIVEIWMRCRKSM